MPDEDRQADENLNSDVTLEKLQADLDGAMNGWKRAAADFENYKKRKESENKELTEFAREVTVAKLLPTLDVLEQALKHLPEYRQPADGGQQTDFEKQYQNWQVGVKGILMQLDGVLGELGIKKIEAVGQKFNPHLHEAVREQESEEDDGTIIDELQTGFMLNGKVIRPSQVVISKKAAKGGE